MTYEGKSYPGFTIKSPLLRKGGDLTESAASTFTSEAISLPSQPFDNIGVIIVGVEFDLGTLAEFTSSVTENANEYIQAQITEELETAMVAVDDENLIASVLKRVFGTIAVGPANSVSHIDYIKLGLNRHPYLVPPEQGFMTMTEEIRAAVQSTDSGTARGMSYAIYYYIVKFTEKMARDIAVREAYET